MKFEEMEVIGACARRFDGYRYVAETGFNPAEALARYFEGGSWDNTQDELMAMLFMLCRAFHWVLEYETESGRCWRALRVLFLILCDREVPEKYRHPEAYAEWQKGYAPHLSALVGEIRLIHEGTAYEDSERPCLT